MTMDATDAVIVDCVRTPMARSKDGAYKSVRAEELSARLIDALFERNLDVVAIGVHPVFPRPEHTTPDTLLPAFGDELARCKPFPNLGGHDAHLARFDDGDRNNLPFIEDRVEEVTAFAQGFFANPFLTLAPEFVPVLAARHSWP